MAEAELIHGDCLSALKGYASGTFSAVVTDPPYGLAFMGKHWDHGVPGAVYWEEILRVCAPGAPLLAFGGTRTFHRLACAIEDAGWIIKDCLAWNYASGFPKSHNISKAIDKKLGAERKVVGSKRLTGNACVPTKEKGGTYAVGCGAGVPKDVPVTVAGSSEEALWEGWGSALKPAWEPILLAMKPLDGTYAENALKHGVAGINIDATRIGNERRFNSSASENKIYGQFKGRETEGRETEGRWPANFFLSHTPACRIVGYKDVKGRELNRYADGPKPFGGGVGHDFTSEKTPPDTVPVWECSEDCPCRVLDEQSGISKSNGHVRHCTKPATHIYGKFGAIVNVGHSDSGGASRFFHCVKANKKERGIYNTHPTVKPVALMRYLCRLVKMPQDNLILDPFCGSGSTLIAALEEGLDCCGVDLELDHLKIAARRLRDRGLADPVGKMSAMTEPLLCF